MYGNITISIIQSYKVSVLFVNAACIVVIFIGPGGLSAQPGVAFTSIAGLYLNQSYFNQSNLNLQFLINLISVNPISINLVSINPVQFDQI